MRLFAILILCAAAASAQTTPANPLVAVSKAMNAISVDDILRSADKIPESIWTFQPTKEVRTVGQLFAHIADAQYEFCGVVNGDSVSKSVEKTKKTKAEIVPALKEAFAYCDAAYAKLTDATAAQLVPFMGMRVTKLGAMDFDTAHNFEHYGNLVTYMRIKGIVPPSSEPQPAAPAAKKQ